MTQKRPAKMCRLFSCLTMVSTLERVPLNVDPHSPIINLSVAFYAQEQQSGIFILKRLIDLRKISEIELVLGRLRRLMLTPKCAMMPVLFFIIAKSINNQR